MDIKILVLVLALGISCGCRCSGGVRTTDIYPHESGIDSIVLQKINLQQQQQQQQQQQPESIVICALCKKIAAPVLKFLSNSSNQEKIKSFLDHVCDILLGDLKKKCNDEVATYYPLLIEQFAIWTPTTFCIDIQLCRDIHIPSTDLSEDISDTCNAQLKTIEILTKDFEGFPEKADN